MKLLNALICLCFTLSLVGCAANRPHVTHAAAETPPADGTVVGETPVCEKPEPEHPVWDKCKDGAQTAALWATAPIWGPFFLFMLWTLRS